MEEDDRRNGSSQQSAGSREPQRASRPAPGKVTRTSKLSLGRGAAIQRKAVAPTSGGTAAPKARSAWEQTMDPWMDAAHRGVTALAERAHDTVQARGNIQADDPASVHRAAAAGVSGASSALPYFDRIQESFGEAHDLSEIRAHQGGDAATASKQMGALAAFGENRIVSNFDQLEICGDGGLAECASSWWRAGGNHPRAGWRQADASTPPDARLVLRSGICAA